MSALRSSARRGRAGIEGGVANNLSGVMEEETTDMDDFQTMVRTHAATLKTGSAWGQLGLSELAAGASNSSSLPKYLEPVFLHSLKHDEIRTLLSRVKDHAGTFKKGSISLPADSMCILEEKERFIAMVHHVNFHGASVLEKLKQDTSGSNGDKTARTDLIDKLANEISYFTVLLKQGGDGFLQKTHHDVISKFELYKVLRAMAMVCDQRLLSTLLALIKDPGHVKEIDEAMKATVYSTTPGFDKLYQLPVGAVRMLQMISNAMPTVTVETVKQKEKLLRQFQFKMGELHDGGFRKQLVEFRTCYDQFISLVDQLRTQDPFGARRYAHVQHQLYYVLDMLHEVTMTSGVDFSLMAFVTSILGELNNIETTDGCHYSDDELWAILQDSIYSMDAQFTGRYLKDTKPILNVNEQKGGRVRDGINKGGGGGGNHNSRVIDPRNHGLCFSVLRKGYCTRHDCPFKHLSAEEYGMRKICSRKNCAVAGCIDRHPNDPVARTAAHIAKCVHASKNGTAGGKPRFSVNQVEELFGGTSKSGDALLLKGVVGSDGGITFSSVGQAAAEVDSTSQPSM
jgi:hypothetical protein